MKKYKALVIGCGNIGAGYDIDNAQVLTHCKAYSLMNNIDFSVTDINTAKAKKIATKYNVNYWEKITDKDLLNFDFVSICVATQFHFEWLSRLSKIKNLFIICEKPIFSSLNEIELFKSSTFIENKILVNYIRRFQEGYQLLKNRLQNIIENNDIITDINIKYQRGLLNNAGHALDLISFLLNDKIEFGKIFVINKKFDSFDYDPTISGCFLINNQINTFLIGLIDLDYSIFEIEIYTKQWKIEILNSGDSILYYKTNGEELVRQKKFDQTEVLKDYMLSVIKTAVNCVEDNQQTNFSSALKTNEYILNQITLCQS
jgi:predicted dehydrogenase